MARDHARLQLGIWKDADFRSLTREGQHMYLMLLSQPSLSYCGVMDWWPNRLALLSHGTEEGDVYAAVKELIDADFVALDADTSELLVRSYVRHDGLFQRSNMGKAVARALERVASLELTDLVMKELARYYATDPNQAGWNGFADALPDQFTVLSAMASRKA